MRIVIYLLVVLTFTAYGEGNTNSLINPDWSRMNAKQRYDALIFTTPAYQKEVLQLLIEEANRVAQELNLQDDLPIARTNLLEAYISPPRLAYAAKHLGNITTSNYVYYISQGDKFSSLVKVHLEQEERELISQDHRPLSQMDTNAAYQLAMQFLQRASMDTEALNTNCTIYIATCLPEGRNGGYFVPIYWITWAEKAAERGGASVELYLPTKSILQLHVNKSEYILRKPLVITNLDYLLSQTNAVTQKNALISQ